MASKANAFGIVRVGSRRKSRAYGVAMTAGSQCCPAMGGLERGQESALLLVHKSRRLAVHGELCGAGLTAELGVNRIRQRLSQPLQLHFCEGELRLGCLVLKVPDLSCS